MTEKSKNPIGMDELSVRIKKEICGSYVFYGEEDYLKSHYRDEIYSRVMTEGLDTFNYFPISFSPASAGRDDALARLSDAVDAVPVMQDKKLIVISDLSPASLAADALEAFCHALATANRSDDTVCIVYCRADEMEADYKLESSAVYKKLSAVSGMVRFDLQPRGRLIAWTKRHFTEEMILLSDEAAGLLVDLCAGRMMPLSGEISKLICYAKFVKGGSTPRLDTQDVQKIAAVSDPDDAPFALVNAASSWKLTDMLSVFEAAHEQREEPVALLARLSRVFLDMFFIKTALEDGMSSPEIAKSMRMKDFRVSRYISAVQKVPIGIIEKAIRLAYETDVKMKSTPSDAWVLLDEMLIRIYAPKSLWNSMPSGIR